MAGRRRLMFAKNFTVDYLRFTALESCTFTLTIGSNVPTSNLSYIEYSIDDGQTWTKTDNVASTTITITTPTVAVGDSVLWRGSGTKMVGTTYNTNLGNESSQFSSTGQCNVSGDIRTLLGLNKPENVTSAAYMYKGLFNQMTTVVDASELIMPSTLANYILYRIFYGCTSLTTPPQLPATTLADYCYEYMFYGCSSLTAAPELPALSTTTYCYHYMFYGCTSLTTPPELPATTIGMGSYEYMFYGCTSLTTAPILPSTGQLQYYSYRYMFQNDSLINYVKALFISARSSSSTQYWLSGVASTGIFVKNINATWTYTGENGVPTGWTLIYYDPSDDKYYTDKHKTQECDDHGNPI